MVMEDFMVRFSRYVLLTSLFASVLALAQVPSAAAGQAAPGEALVKAAAKGDLATVNSLLAQGMDVNAPDKNGNTALMEAARTGKNDVVTALIAAKADLNAQNKDGWTPPMRAIFAAQTTTLKTLLEAGAKIDPTNKKGESALDVALTYTGNVRPDLLPLLAKAGADVKGATIKGQPALIYAISTDQDGLVVGLLKAGADPDIKDSKGRPAITLAAKSGYLESGVKIVAALVAAGVDVNARDDRGRSALENAVDVSKMQYRNAAERKSAGVVVYTLASRGADQPSIAAARDLAIKNTYVLFDTMIFEGQKKAASLARERSSPAAAAPAGQAPAKAAAAKPAGPPPAGCPAATKVTKLASPSEAFKVSQPIDIATITSAKAIVEKDGTSVRVFLTNRNYAAAAMNSSMVVPVKNPGDVIVKLRFMNGSTPVAPGEYTPAAGWGKPLSVIAELVVTGGKPSGAEITMVPAQSSDTGKATVTALEGGYVCGTFDLKGSLGETAGAFVATIEP
jgi:ankyrin repeat protein